MNVYDTVNQLANEIKQSEEYLNFKQAKKTILFIPEYKMKIEEFEKARYEEQLNSIQNGKSNEKAMMKIQNLYKDLIQIPEIKKYFDAELKFNILLGDVNKIISEAVKDVIS